jgi:dTDP-4-dehydrorhamnose reductase
LQISELTDKYSFKLLQIGTDCVFSGKVGSYTENSDHDSEDLYGNSKSLGEPINQNSMLIRTSFIGPEIENRLSFYEWVKNTNQNMEVMGYTDHLWNGISTNVLSRILLNLILENSFSAGTIHLVPMDSISKYELIELVKKKANRMDLKVTPTISENQINRTLSTVYSDQNQKLWTLAGYKSPPSIVELIDAIKD